MGVFKVSNEGLIALESTSFEQEGLRERFDLQRLLRSKIEILAPDTLVIAEEFAYWDEGRRRIDLLALDKQANLVVIELKRDETGAHMELQAIRYAAMISTMTFEQAVSARAGYLRTTGANSDEASQSILDFLEWDEPQPDEFARDVRVILVSAEFSKELTTAVLWLNDRNLDIRCVRLRPCKIDGILFLDIQQVLPLPEVEEYQVRVREQATERRIAGRDTRDLTKYLFEGERLNKRRLVLAIVRAYVRDHPATTLQELEEVFPAHLQGSHRVFKTIENARGVLDRTGHKRHFIEDDEVVKLGDGYQIAVASMWGADNLKGFLERASEFGYLPKEDSVSGVI
jgi:hypothetical protein